MATQIGIVKAIIGEVTATAADGSSRTLQAGDRVFANELITTGPGGAIEIEFADGSLMDLGRNSQAMLDSEVFDPNDTAVAQGAEEDVPDDVAAIQQALLEGEDPTEIGEATAAGTGVEGGNEGNNTAVFVDYLNPAVTPDAGFDTVGVTNEYDLPEEDIIVLEEEEDVPPTVPQVSVSVDVEIDVEDPQSPPPEDGVPTPEYPVLVEGNAASVLEGTSEGTKQVVFIINLSESFSEDVQVTYILQPVSENGAADNPDDWFNGASPQTVTIPAGSTSFPVYVEIVEDHLDEGNGTFEIVLIDADNATINPDASSATVTIFDDDTTPVAQDDFNSVSEDEGEGTPVTEGNVINGSNDAGNDPLDQQDSDDDGDALQIVSFSDNDDETAATPGDLITGQYGTLTMDINGNYTYTLTSNDDPVIQGLSEGETLTDVFSYVVTDTYNSPQTATLTIVINGTDDGVIIRGLDGEGAEEVVYEADLADGSSPDAPALTQSGSFDFSAPDGFGETGSVSIGGQVFTLVQLQALAGSNATISTDFGDLVLTGYTGDAFGGTISYEYTLNDNVDNDSEAGASDGGFTDSFAVVVTDDDGSSDNASLDVQIVDDEPTANDDGPVATEEDIAVIITVDSNDVEGADSVDLTDGTKVFVSTQPANGSVVYNNDGTFTYTPDSGFFGQDSFEYTITDEDGDTDAALVTVNIVEDAEPTVSVTDGSVNEAALDDGSNPVSDAETTTGSFTIVTGSDSLAKLLVGGVDVTGGGMVNGTYGVLTVTETDGVYTWSYTLSDNTTDHTTQGANVDGVVDEFSVTVEDSDGDVSPADNLTIQVIDDVPTAANDTTSQVGENSNVVYNVINNADGTSDEPGADGATLTAASVNTGSGSVSFDANGEITYTPAAGEEGTVVIDYTITDGDDDTSDATLTIQLADDSEPVISLGNAAVDETGGLDSVDGTLSVDFGNDTGDVQLSATNATWDGNTNTLTANDGSWKIVNNQNGTYTFTQLTAMAHLGGDDASLDIVVNVVAADSDGDVDNTNNFTVTVYDDGPVVTDHDGTININDATPTLDVLDYDLGEDGLGSVSFSLTGSSVPLTSGGESVLTESVDLGDGREALVGYLESGDNAGYQDGEDGIVFTLAPEAGDLDGDDGTYELSLSSDNVLDLPQTTVSVSFSGISASGPIDSIDTTGGEITISVIPGNEGPDDVNANANYVGINNNNMDDGESIQYFFNTTLVNDLQLDVFNNGGTGEIITWTTFNSADPGNTTDTGQITLGATGLSDPITADFDYDTIQFSVSGGSFKVGGVTYSDAGDPQDILMEFDYQGTDSDGDQVTGSIDVTVSGTTTTSITGSDPLSHPDSQVDAS